jgi:hypothetical protein
MRNRPDRITADAFCESSPVRPGSRRATVRAWGADESIVVCLVFMATRLSLVDLAGRAAGKDVTGPKHCASAAAILKVCPRAIRVAESGHGVAVAGAVQRIDVARPVAAVSPCGPSNEFSDHRGMQR